LGSIGGDLAALDKALLNLISCGHPLHIAQEARPCATPIRLGPRRPSTRTWLEEDGIQSRQRRICTARPGLVVCRWRSA
jgi:hypothetical protein